MPAHIYPSIQVNTNGVISFNQSYLSFTQQSLPVSLRLPPLILPFWIDIDIGCQGEIYFRQATNNETLKQAKLLLYDHRPASRFNPTLVFIATWRNVRPYPCSSSSITNTFQAVLMTDGQVSYVCFLYEDIQWAMKQNWAQIGFNAGDGNRSFTAPFGLTNETQYLDNLSNINGRRGVFIYQVDGKVMSCYQHTSCISFA